MLSKKITRIGKVSNNNKSFLLKLYDIVNDITYKDIISWNIEGTGIIIKNINALCELVLPKYYHHQNYSSFIRQLNLYGFHKIQGIIKDGEGFENCNFKKNNTKDEIKQFIIQNKRKKILDNYIYDNNKESINIKELLYLNEDDLIKSLSDKIENNSKIIDQLKKEMIDLKKMNKILKEKIQYFHNNINGHTILIQKILNFQRENNINKEKKKSNNLKELFKKYLYHLKIYSPYFTINNNNNINYEIESIESIKKDNIFNNNIRDLFNNHNNDNSESFLEENSIFESELKMGNFDFNINYNNSFFSFLYFNKDAKK
jgi:hypothetical protein